MPSPKDLTNEVFGRLTALHYSYTAKGYQRVWLCRCACGSEMQAFQGNLISGHTRSCGCLRTEECIARTTVHGHATSRGYTRAYRSWNNMKTRCYNPNATRYSDWGGRGIRVCDRWRNSFENFLADMGEPPPGMTIDRWPDNDGHYEPGNVRWATPADQTANRRPRTDVMNRDATSGRWATSSA